MTQTLTDSQLLKAYLDGDRAAFTRLRECHITMVYATAARLAPAQAEDVTQAVFLLLAQKAVSLQSRGSLGGWLYKSTCLCAKAARRLEARRQKHEREAANMRPQTCSPASASAADLLPLLDPALATLNKTDRDVVVLRYLQNQSLDQVAAALGLSVAAATKRGQRAVERLRDWFIRHGHDVSGSALSSTLAIEAARQAPLGLLGAPASPCASALASAVRKTMAHTVWTVAASVAAVLTIIAGATLPSLRSDHAPNRPRPVAATLPAADPTSAPTTMMANPLLPDTAIITLRGESKDRPPMYARLYFQNPDSARIEYLQADGTVDAGKPPDVISDGFRLNSDTRSKLFLIEPTTRQDPMTATILMLAALRPPAPGTLPPPVTIELTGAPKTTIVLEARDANPRPATAPTTAPALRRFEACRAGEPTPAGTGASLPLFGQARVFLSYDPTGACRRVEMVEPQSLTDCDVVLNPKLPPGLFELKGPPGYTDVREGIFPRLDPELRKIAERYCQAREALQHYRMAVFPEGDRFPRYRNIRDGDRWRLDEMDLGGMLRERDLFEVKDPSSLTPLSAPYCLESLDAPVSHVVMTYHDQLAQVGFNYSTTDGGSRIRAGWLTPPMLSMMTTPAEDAARLAERQKQRWYNQAPRDMVGNPTEYYARPQPVKPGPEPRITADRSITAFARTADGHWYPKTLGKTHIYLDAEGEISPSFFDWPAGAPLPGDGTSVKIVSFLEGTPEAKEHQARNASQRHLYSIVQGCLRYAKRHNGQWPASLQTLVDENYIKSEDLQNPRQLAAKPGYTYRRPQQGKIRSPCVSVK